MHTVVWQARQSEDNCLSFPISLVFFGFFFGSCFLTSFQAILLHVKRTKRMEVIGVCSGVDFVFLFFTPPHSPLSLLFTGFITMVDRAWEAGQKTWLRLGLIHTSSSTLLWWRWWARKLIERATSRNRAGERESVKWVLSRRPGKSGCIGSV